MSSNEVYITIRWDTGASETAEKASHASLYLRLDAGLYFIITYFHTLR